MSVSFYFYNRSQPLHIKLINIAKRNCPNCGNTALWTKNTTTKQKNNNIKILARTRNCDDFDLSAAESTSHIDLIQAI